MLVHESSERYDQKQNWVRYKLFNDNFTLFGFEGYTIKNKQVSGLFDRKLVKDISLLNLTTNKTPASRYFQVQSTVIKGFVRSCIFR